MDARADTAEKDDVTAPGPAVLIVNAQARSGAAAYDQARKLLQQRGIVLDECIPVHQPARLPEIMAQALSRRPSCVLVGGGDGTISAAVNALAGKDIALGLLPLGTANSFARSLHLPLELEEAIDVIADGRTQQVDLGRINGKYFTTAASIGLSSEIQRRKPDTLKSLLGRFAYPTVAGLVLPKFKPFTCMLTLDDGECRSFPAALEVRIANGPYQGGVDAAPDASVTSGDLVVHIVTGRSKLRLLKTWGKVVAGLDPDGPGYETFRGKHLRIATDPPQYVNVDGEAAMKTPVEISVARKALRVIVPRK